MTVQEEHDDDDEHDNHVELSTLTATTAATVTKDNNNNDEIKEFFVNDGDDDDDKDDDDDIMLLDPHGGTPPSLGGDLRSVRLGIFKGMVGPAILYLPHGFATAGYAVALPLMVVTTCMYLHAAHCLLQTFQVVETQLQLQLQLGQEQQQEPVSSTIHSLQPQQQPYVPIKQQQQQQELSSSSSSSIPTASSSLSRQRSKQQQHHNHPHNHHHNHRHKHILSYPGLAHRAFGITGERLVQMGIALMQSGVCLTYLIFVPHNLRASAQAMWGVDWSTTMWLGVVVLMEIPLSMISDIRQLVPTNAAANGLIFYGLTMCLMFAFGHVLLDGGSGSDGEEANEAASTGTDFDNNGERYLFAHFSTTEALQSFFSSIVSSNDVELLHETPPIPLVEYHDYHEHRFLHLQKVASQWYLFVGTSVLLFEGSITLLIPLQDSVSTPSDRRAFPRVYTVVIVSIIIFYIFFGLTCVLAFGNNVHTVLTTSLPSPNRITTSVQLAYSLAVLMTYPLQNFPALEIATKYAMTALSDMAHATITTTAAASTTTGNTNYANVRFHDKMRLYMATTWSSWSSWTQRSILSSLTVMAMAVVALLTMDHLDKVVSLMGSLLGCPIAFCVPPLIHNVLVLNVYGEDDNDIDIGTQKHYFHGAMDGGNGDDSSENNNYSYRSSSMEVNDDVHDDEDQDEAEDDSNDDSHHHHLHSKLTKKTTTALPVMRHDPLHFQSPHARQRQKVLNYIVAGAGFVAMILASIATIVSW